MKLNLQTTHQLAVALTLSLNFALISNAHAIEGTRGGAEAVVCREKSGKIKSVELLDLWEARALYHRLAKLSNAPLKIQVMNALQGVGQATNPSNDAGFGNVTQSNMENTARMFLQPNPSLQRLTGVSLTLTGDSYEIAKPSDCEIEQLVNYKDNPGLIYLNQDLYSKLNLTNQAAVIVHESIYAELRSIGSDSDSLRTRRAVGLIFSGTKLPTSPVPPSHMVCFAKPDHGSVETSFDIFLAPDEKNYLGVATFENAQIVLGYFPGEVIVSGMSLPTGTTHENLPYYVSQDVCQILKSDDDFLMIFINSKSPITYSGEISMSVACPNGKVQINLNPKRTGVGLPTIGGGPAMTCKMIGSGNR